MDSPRMNIAVIGGDGLVGSRFIELSAHDTHSLDLSNGCDITDPESIKKACDDLKPDTIINFAAYTNVDEAEKELNNSNGIVWKINVQGSQNVAQYCQLNDIPLIHISTDFIFSGDDDERGPFHESTRRPQHLHNISWYGWTKKKAEDIVQLAHPDSAIVRISYPYRASFPHKKDFLRSILDLYDHGRLYPMFSDQTITPTYIDELSEALDILVTSFKPGIYHAASSDTCTPYLFATYALEKYTGAPVDVQEGSIKAFLEKTGAAPRPQYGGLAVEDTERRLGMSFMSWKDAVKECLHSM